MPHILVEKPFFLSFLKRGSYLGKNYPKRYGWELYLFLAIIVAFVLNNFFSSHILLGWGIRNGMHHYIGKVDFDQYACIISYSVWSCHIAGQFINPAQCDQSQCIGLSRWYIQNNQILCAFSWEKMWIKNGNMLMANSKQPKGNTLCILFKEDVNSKVCVNKFPLFVQ